MADYMTLLGAEQVQNASRNMANAAETMIRASSEMQAAIERQRQVLDDFLIQFSLILENTRRV